MAQTNKLLLWLVLILFFISLVRFAFDIKTDSRFEDLLSFFENFELNADISSWFSSLRISDFDLPDWLEWLNFLPRFLNFIIQSLGMILNMLVTVTQFVYKVIRYIFAGTV